MSEHARGDAQMRAEVGLGPSRNGRNEGGGTALGTSFKRTDLGNAERLVARHGENLRYCHVWRKWLVWDGKQWKIDTTGEVTRLAAETVRAIYDEAKNEPDEDVRKALARHAVASESRARIEAMMALAQSQPGIPVQPEDLDTDLWLLNCENGTLDLKSGELRDHRRADLITKLAPVAYLADAEAPRFEQFLKEVFAGDDDVISLVQRFAGYTLAGSTEERVFAILHGRGKNGKTTLVELFGDVMGDYAKNTDVETVLQKEYGRASNDVAALAGARLVSASEVEQGRHLAEGKIKNLTGSDTVTARFLFAEFFDFKPQFKLWLSTNNKPVIRGTDDAIWDRIKLIPFGERFEGERRDAKLPEKLREELPGVLAWMVRGCLEWQHDGLGEAEKVSDATADYRAEMDTLGAFIEDCCVLHPDAEAPATPLYKAYKEWCAEANEHAEKQTAFGRRLGERGFESFDYTSGPHRGRKGWRGIGLRVDSFPPDDGGEGGDPPPETPKQPQNHRQEGRDDANYRHPESREDKPDSHDDVSSVDSCRQNSALLVSKNSIRERLSENHRQLSTVDSEEHFSREEPPDSAPLSSLSGERLTTEEVQRYRELVRQGMAPRFARAEMLRNRANVEGEEG